MKEIKISCSTSDTLDINELADLQGGLKTRGQKDFDRIKRSINKHGFAAPFFVWKNKSKNYVLDGHGRLETLKQMRDIDGVEIPPLPVVYIACKNKEEAKELLLKITSQYGKVSASGLEDYIQDVPGFNYDDLDLRFEKITVFNQEDIEKDLSDCGLKFPVVIAQDQEEYDKLQKVKRSLKVFGDDKAVKLLIENALRDMEMP